MLDTKVKKNGIFEPVESAKKIVARQIEKTDEVAFSVYQTMDYDKFEFINGNREIVKSNLNNLIISMKIHDAKVPILIAKEIENGKTIYYVLDGQHRLTARRLLGLPVYYYIVDMKAGALSIITTTRAQKAINSYGIAKLFAKEGYTDYQILLDFQKRYQIALGLCAALLSNFTSVSGDNMGSKTNYHVGKFKAKYYEKAIDFMNQIDLMYNSCNKNKVLKQRTFITALISASKVEGFEMNKFVEKTINNRFLLETKATISQYRDLIHDIYNYKSRDKINLRSI